MTTSTASKTTYPALVETYLRLPWGPARVRESADGIETLDFLSEDEGERAPGVPGFWAEKLLAAKEDAPALSAIALVIRGTAFQQAVWHVLRAIPRGHTLSYRALAKAVGRPKAVRAVASACAVNRIALLIPCHRIVHIDGRPGAYRWGATRKMQLLRAEGAALAS